MLHLKYGNIIVYSGGVGLGNNGSNEVIQINWYKMMSRNKGFGPI